MNDRTTAARQILSLFAALALPWPAFAQADQLGPNGAGPDPEPVIVARPGKNEGISAGVVERMIPSNAVVVARMDSGESAVVSGAVRVDDVLTELDLEEGCTLDPFQTCLWRGKMGELEEGSTVELILTSAATERIVELEVGPPDLDPPLPLEVELDTLYFNPNPGTFLQTFRFVGTEDDEGFGEEGVRDVALIELFELGEDGERLLHQSAIIEHRQRWVVRPREARLEGSAERTACFQLVFHDVAGNTSSSEELCNELSEDNAEVTGVAWPNPQSLLNGCSHAAGAKASWWSGLLAAGLIGLAGRRRCWRR